MTTGVTKRWKTKHGYLLIQEDDCKGCNFCIEFCPKQVLVRSEQFNAKGYYPPVVADPEGCVNCTFCELICPDFAIWSEKAEAPETQGAEGSHG
jgi:2-oxoglutarate ferredoxin oxidoreductase subunit delta